MGRGGLTWFFGFLGRLRIRGDARLVALALELLLLGLAAARQYAPAEFPGELEPPATHHTRYTQ